VYESLRSKLGNLIDSSWYHSWHWGDNFEEDALESLRSEYKYAYERLAQLREAEAMLKSRGHHL
jgi:hypothetical protein